MTGWASVRGKSHICGNACVCHRAKVKDEFLYNEVVTGPVLSSNKLETMGPELEPQSLSLSSDSFFQQENDVEFEL